MTVTDPSRRAVVRAFFVNQPFAAFRLLVGLVGVGCAVLCWDLFLAEPGDPEGGLIALLIAIVCLIVATGGD